MHVVAISMVRDEVDVIALSVLHHLAVGCDRILVADNDSTDGTDCVLAGLNAADRRVQWRRWPGPYRQGEVLTALAREAKRSGADWVIPFDADEFWVARRGDVRAELAESGAGILRAQLRTFIQRRDQQAAASGALLTMARRGALDPGAWWTAEDRVERREIAFVEMQYPPKYLSRAADTLQIRHGNTIVDGIAGPIEETDELYCLHAPLRSRERLEAKARNAARTMEPDSGWVPHQSWHLRRWWRLQREHTLDAEWAANSYEGESLDVFGVPHPVIRDDALCTAVLPHIEAAARLMR